MAGKQFLKKHENCILSLAMALILAGILAARFDFYYDLNDDVLIKDILSGVYSGTPDGHTMQLLYPLGALLALLYRGLSIPVFGAFLLFCQFGSIWAVGYRSTVLVDEERAARDGAPFAPGMCSAASVTRLAEPAAARVCSARDYAFAARSAHPAEPAVCSAWNTTAARLGVKGVLLFAEALFWFAAMGSHLVYLQYTVTAGMLAGAAIFWVVTAKGKERFWALLLYWLSFCLRPEMALLCLPLAGAGGLCIWGREKQIFSKESLRHYLGLFAALVIGMGVFYGLDVLAYSDPDWKDFRQFFDERTTLYDYHLDFVEQYDENREAYEETGVSRTLQEMLKNYNFGAADEIDTQMLSSLAVQAKKTDAKESVLLQVKKAIWRLAHENWLSKSDLPWNVVWLAVVFAWCSCCLQKGNRRYFWQPVFVVCVGGMLWSYLLMQGRMVDRVTHPLYLAQILLAAGLWGTAGNRQLEMRAAEKCDAVGHTDAATGAAIVCSDVENSDVSRNVNTRSTGRIHTVMTAAVCGVILLLCILRVPGMWQGVVQEQTHRETVNQTNEDVFAYCKKHASTLFLEDVYSTVAYSEKIMLDRDKPFNYDLLGGWLVKSPLTKQKLSAFGYASMGEAARSSEKVCLLADEGTDMSWLTEYLEERGEPGMLLRIGSAGEGVEVYQFLSEERINEMFRGEEIDAED